jgi:hypothetical protein
LFYLLHIYECVVAMHGEERGRVRWQVGPAVVAACELPQSVRGSECGCVAVAMVVGSGGPTLIQRYSTEYPNFWTKKNYTYIVYICIRKNYTSILYRMLPKI